MKTLRLRRVLLLLLIACAILALASCDGNHTHTPSEWLVDTDATCTEEGEKHTECTDCGEVIDTKSIPKKGHSYVDGVCSACDAIDPELGADPSCEHDFVTHEAKAPTCTEIGWNEYVICSRCNHTTYREKSALGHDYQLGVCSRCGSKEQEGSKGLEFTSNGDGTCYVSGIGTCTDTELIIPSVSPAGDRVTGIGDMALGAQPFGITDPPFFGVWDLISVTIPDGVTSIGDGAFFGCRSLTQIAIPDVVTNIGMQAFYGCESLTSISIPNSIKNVGLYAFDNCTNIEAYIEEDGAVYLGNENNPYLVLVKVSSSLYQSPASFTVNSRTKCIADGAFQRVASFVDIVIPARVIGMNGLAFMGCDDFDRMIISEDNPEFILIDGNIYTKDGKTLVRYFDKNSSSKVTIPDSVTHIGAGAFSGLYYLEEVIIPGSAASIGDGAFYNCSNLKSITIPDSVTSIGDGAFYNCSNLKSITIPDSVTSIGDWVFSNCTNLTSITMPNRVTSIGNWAFSNCTNLTSITIPNRVTSIGDGAFLACYDLVNITIPDSVTSIGNWAFQNCSSLTSITVDDGNTAYKSIDGNLYTKDGKTLIQYATGKTDTSFTIPDGIINIGDGAFYQCDSLTGITIPAGVTSIGEGAFYYCVNLTSVTIPVSVTSIGDYAFNACERLTNINIPDGVSSIGKGVFYRCNSLKSLAIPDGVTSIGDFAISFCGSLTDITIPDSVTSIGCYAFSWCSSLTNITIPDSVTSIGDGAFYYCSLSSVTFENTTGWWYSSTSGAPSGTSIPSSDLADPTKAAEYLNSTYSHYYWHRS